MKNKTMYLLEALNEYEQWTCEAFGEERHCLFATYEEAEAAVLTMIRNWEASGEDCSGFIWRVNEIDVDE